MHLSRTIPLLAALKREGEGKGDDGRRLDLFKIGPILKDAREGKALSLASVAEALFIKAPCLGAIESGSWEALPHPVYVKGYIKAYAAYLGISEAVAADLKGAGALPEENAKGGHVPGDRDRTFMKKLFIICSSVIGLVLGIAVTPGLQAPPPVRLEDLLAACQSTLMGVRKIMMP